MKNKILFSFAMLLFASCSFAQHIKVDTINFVKPGTEEVILDASITENLVPFNDADDAVIYFYRLKSMVGAAVKWEVQVGDHDPAKLSQMEYIIEHVNTKEKSYWVKYPDMIINYVGFKPNKYYMIRLKGFTMATGYFTLENYAEIKECELYKPKDKK